MCLSVISNGQMNCFVINALCLTDRNLSKYGAPEGRRDGIKESLLIKEGRRAVNTVPGALCRPRAFNLSTGPVPGTQKELADRGGREGPHGGAAFPLTPRTVSESQLGVENGTGSSRGRESCPAPRTTLCQLSTCKECRFHVCQSGQAR